MKKILQVPNILQENILPKVIKSSNQPKKEKFCKLLLLNQLFLLPIYGLHCKTVDPFTVFRPIQGKYLYCFIFLDSLYAMQVSYFSFTNKEEFKGAQ